jgi:hypothetical protein
VDEDNPATDAELTLKRCVGIVISPSSIPQSVDGESTYGGVQILVPTKCLQGVDRDTKFGLMEKAQRKKSSCSGHSRGMRDRISTLEHAPVALGVLRASGPDGVIMAHRGEH